MVVQIVYETHATTVDNENGVATGWLPGELSATGRDNARELGCRRRGDGIDLVIASDLARAVHTVEIAFAGSDVPVSTDPRLREVDYGDLNGAPVEVVHRQRRERVDTPFPGGQSYREVTTGVRTLLDELLRDRDGQRVLLVGHAATRFALDHLLTGRPLETVVVAPFAWREGWTYDLATDAPRIELLDGEGATHVAAELTGVYRSAFTAPGYDESEESVEHFREETQLPAHTAWRDSVARPCASTRSWSGSPTATRVLAASGGATSSPSVRRSRSSTHGSAGTSSSSSSPSTPAGRAAALRARCTMRCCSTFRTIAPC